MEEYNCRTCLAPTDIKKCIGVTKKCYLQKTLKEVITYIVPEMEHTLQDEDLICRSCFRILKLVMQFIEGCLEVETIRAENSEYFVNNGEGSQNIKQEGPQIKHEVLEEYTDGNSEVVYEDYTEVDENGVPLPGSAKKIRQDHDYLNKKAEGEYDEYEDSQVSTSSLGNKMEEDDDHFMEYDSAAEEDEEQAHGSENYNRPIEIVYQDSLGTHKVQMGADNQEGIYLDSDLQKEEIEYVDCQNEESLTEDGTRVYTCSTCSEVFTSMEGYQIHMEVHPPYKCQYCDKGLMSNIAYKSHILWHKEKGYMCEFCGRCFKSSGSLNMHINCTHEDETIYTCEQCPKQYKHKFKLESHIRSVHLKIGRHQCQECGKYFQNKETCESHYRLIHLQLKPFMCYVCGVEFGRKDYLQKHINRHMEEKSSPTEPKEIVSKPSRIRLKNPGQPVVCKVCGKQIKTVHLLRAHLQTHVRIKRHKCKFCELTFTLSTNRDRHEKLHESDPENKFRCNICWKRVKTEEDLERHVAGHRNRPPQHSCDICGEKFHRRYLVDNHLLDKHTGPGDIEKAEEEIVFKNLLEYVDPKLLE